MHYIGNIPLELYQSSGEDPDKSYSKIPYVISEYKQIVMGSWRTKGATKKSGLLTYTQMLQELGKNQYLSSVQEDSFDR